MPFDDRQLRRGLTQAFTFATKLRQAQEANARINAERAAQTQQRANTESADRRIKTALDLARLGNVQAEGGLQNYLGSGDVQSAFGGIGQFDQGAAQNRNLAEKHLRTLLAQGQYEAANELGAKVGLPTRFAPSRQETAAIDLLGARKLSEEADRESQAAITTARVKHITALEKVARQKADKIAKEIKSAGSSGKLNLDNVKAMREVLSASNAILQEQLEKISEAPDFYTDAQRTQVNPAYTSALRELSKANKYNRDLLQLITEFQAENTFPAGRLPGAESQSFPTPDLRLPGQLKRVAPPNPAFQQQQFETEDGIRWTIDPRTGNYIQVR